MKVTIVSGARPNFMKIAPICRAIDAARKGGKNISYRIVYTGPQDDPSLEASLYSDLDMPHPDAYLDVTGNGHSQVAADIMLAFERELDACPAQVVLVVDDMTATMSCAIVAKKRGLKVAHVIAGTRSFDMNMPREVNRTIVDAISDYLFTAGMVANRNLNQEGMIPDYIHYVGNILICVRATTCCSPSTGTTCYNADPCWPRCCRPCWTRLPECPYWHRSIPTWSTPLKPQVSKPQTCTCSPRRVTCISASLSTRPKAS